MRDIFKIFLISALLSIIFGTLGYLRSSEYRFYSNAYSYGNLIIKKTDYAKKNKQLIKNTFDYYNETFAPCKEYDIYIMYQDVSEIYMRDEQRITGMAKWRPDRSIISEIQVATKNRPTCEIIETALHEYRHICEQLRDCYGQDDCWAYELKRNKEHCSNIMEYKHK